jgi:hypothetical protein
MKTVQDWGFISKEQGLVKPKLQENKIFHALTAAYDSNQQQEIYGATENIVRREKELCEMALGDLKKLADSKGQVDDTLKLVIDHYHNRLSVAREKEEKINHLSEDSRKMAEEYKKKTSELAEVKRNLMESQVKLRELAKTTEKLLKKEEELRFIESSLRTELDKNKRNIINGLYEIVTELSDQPAPPVPLTAVIPPVVTPKEPTIPAPPARENRQFQEGLFRPIAQAESREETPPQPSQMHQPLESVWTRDPIPAGNAFAIPEAKPAPSAMALKPGDILEKAARLKMFEPGKALCSKSMVKTQDGEVISEYFYSPMHPKDGRHYIFNTLFAVGSLLNLKAKNEDMFHDRLETIFTDLLSRLEHSRNIHLETFLNQEINQDVIGRMLALPVQDRAAFFETLAGRLLSRIESVGPSRAGLIDRQFRDLPRAEFTPGGMAA